jgi:outer membrane biosynthesis protein TonB
VSVEKKSDRWISLVQSVLLHGLIIGAVVYGVYVYKRKPPPPTPTLAIEGSIVESKDLKSTPPKAAEPPPEPEPAPPPEDQGPPTPTPEELEQQKREAEEAIQKADADRQAQERKQADEKAAAEKAVVEQKAREEADRKKREVDAEAKKAAEAKRVADEKRKAEETKQKAQREADLRKSLEAEEHATELRTSGALRTWLGQIANRIYGAWNRPANAKSGISCVVYLTQAPGGVVTNVRVGDCNGGDALLKESIESAAYGASPLPPPPDPALFDRNLTITFTTG